VPPTPRGQGGPQPAGLTLVTPDRPRPRERWLSIAHGCPENPDRRGRAGSGGVYSSRVATPTDVSTTPPPVPRDAHDGPPAGSGGRGPGPDGPGAGRGPDRGSRWIVIATAVATGAAAGMAAWLGPMAAVDLTGGAVALALFITAALYPAFATFGYLATLPLLAGIDRGALIPLLRPNEAILVVLVAGAVTGAYLRILRGDGLRARFYPLVDVPLAVFLLAASVWPLASMLLRGEVPAGVDYAGTLPMVKLVGLYFLVRYTIDTERRIVTAIRCVVWPGAVVAVIGILQTLKFGPVLMMLQLFWADSSGAYGSDVAGADPTSAADLSERGSATLGSPIAAGDVVIICLVLVMCCGVRGVLGRRERLGLAMVLGAGALAAGQYSTWIAAAVAAVLLARRYPAIRSGARRFAPLGLVAAVVGLPAFIGRLTGIGVEGLPIPESWLGRYDNLVHLFLPHFTWLTTLIGVSPNEVLPAPETWRSVVYLESGVLYFLWIGGIPLLTAFIWLSVRVLRAARPVAFHPGGYGAAASTLDIVWRYLLILTVIDPHLQLRGTGDLIFTLLGITVTGLYARGINVRYPGFFARPGDPDFDPHAPRGLRRRPAPAAVPGAG
jgi:hypothetical protein